MRNHNEKGLLIAIDGASGVGKSTLIKNLAARLEEKGFPMYCTSEPTASKLGDFIRQEACEYSRTVFACLLTADRYAHLERDILPKLQEGYVVIIERYLLSSLVWQCVAGESEQFVLNLNKNIIKPDLQIVLSLEESAQQSNLYEIEQDIRKNQLGKEKRCLDYCALIMEQLNVDVLYVNHTNSMVQNTEDICKKIMDMKKEEKDI